MQGKSQIGHPHIMVDTRPLDTMIQRSISTTIIAECSTKSFGHVFELSVDALSLYDVALHYLEVQSARFETPLCKQYNKFDKCTIYLGAEARRARHRRREFCSFEKIMAENTAYSSRCATGAAASRTRPWS